MSHGPTRIPPKAGCIYCGKSDVILTDEHIVPYFIGGKHIIEKASCLRCADITKRFELEVARNLWGDARASYGAPTRRKKKKRNSHIILPPLKKGDLPLRITYEEYPAPMIFYWMGKAGLLQGVDETLDLSNNWKLKAFTDENKIKLFQKKYPDRFVAKFKNVPDSFGRLIAKIGYGQVICSLDPSDFNPICLPYILGTKKNISYIVGSDLVPAPITPGIGYSLNTIFISHNNESALVIAEVRLLGASETPTYHVVVGTIYGSKVVEKAFNKSGSGLRFDIDSEKTHMLLAEKYHWFPKQWSFR